MRILLAATLAAFTLQAQAEPASVAGFGYAQFTVEPIATDGRSGVAFGADRVRLGGRYRQGGWFGGAEIDINNGDLASRAPGTLPNLIADLYVGYFADNELIFKLGQFKIPVGMDYLTPGNELDIVKRGLDRGLVLDRSLGVMLSGRNVLGYIGYDLGVFNTAGRSPSTLHSEAQVGDINAVAGRLSFDYGTLLHLEASLAGSPESAGTRNSVAYLVTDVGGSLQLDRFRAKAEYIYGSNVRGDDDRNQSSLLLHLGFQLSDRVELVGRSYLGASSVGGTDTSLQNTFIGANYYIGGSRTHRRLQFNYILATGDVESWNGVGGFLSDAFLMQIQVAFDNLLVGR